MQFKEIYLKGGFVITTEPRKDERGSFERTFCANEFKSMGLKHIMVQSNLSKSTQKHTLRGMHYQVNGAEEVKLVRCIKGRIWDVIIDIRPGSATYCQHFGIELSEYNDTILYVPEGFAHGFITLEHNCYVSYQVSNFYTPNSERGIRWNDKTFNINWPVTDPIISEKDNNHPDYQAIQ